VWWEKYNKLKIIKENYRTTDNRKMVHLKSTTSNITSTQHNLRNNTLTPLKEKDDIVPNTERHYEVHSTKNVKISNKSVNKTINHADYATASPYLHTIESHGNKKLSIYSNHKHQLQMITDQYDMLIKNKEKLKDDIKCIPEFMKYLDTKNASKLQNIKSIGHFESDKSVANGSNIGKEAPINNEKTKNIYNGPMDISCCVALDPSLVANKMQAIAKKHRLILVQKNSFNMTCHREGLHFSLEILLLKDTGLTYMKMKRKQGTFSEYNSITTKIIMDVK